MGTRETLKQMKRMVLDGRKDYALIEHAREIVAHIPDKDWVGEVRAIQDWVKQNIRYTRDPHGLETIQSPHNTIQIKHGDCDDQAILVATLLMAVGAPARFVAIAQNPRYYCHVYAETRVGQYWIPVETTEPVELGWQPANVARKMIVHISN